MIFDPGIKIGDELTNEEMRELFQCGNMGGMRRSKKTGTLVIISDDTKELYRDVWKDGILHYTGMGKIGDQVLEGNQNATLYYSDTNGVEVHLFEVMERAVYTYRGVVKLVDKPYKSKQLDNNGNMRNVWMFPLKPIKKYVENGDKDVPEKEVVKLSTRELVRRTEINSGIRKTITTETIVYYRDPYLKELVKRIADGKCQYCGNNAPFSDDNGNPYLEEHHVEGLADGGSDTIDNVVALCPNCHRRMHVLKKLNDIEVLRKVAKENGIQAQRCVGYLDVWNKMVKNKW